MGSSVSKEWRVENIKLSIVRRQSPEWGTISQEAFRIQSRQFCLMAGLPAEQVNMTVDLWDRTFSKPYCSVRQALKDIAEANLAAVVNANFISMEDLQDKAIERDHYYLFIDDDDWLSPNIVSELSPAIEAGDHGVVWGSIAFGTHKTGALQIREIDGFCYTNNYVVSGNLLIESLEKGTSPAQHWDAASILQGRAHTVPKYLSVTNKSPSSTCYLMHVLKGNYNNGTVLQNAIREYLERCMDYQKQLPESVSWAKCVIDRTLEVFRAL